MTTEGLDPTGALTRNVRGADGRDEPLWKALFEASAYKSGENRPTRHDVNATLLAAYGLSVIDTLDAAIDIALGAYGLAGVDLLPLDLIVRDDGLAHWAAAHVERLAAAWASLKTKGSQATVPLFLALVRNEVPLDPRWDAMIPVHSNKTPTVLVEIWRAVPSERREDVLNRQLREAYLPVAYQTAALLAPALRSKVCAKFLSEHVDKLNSPPRASVKAIIKSIDRSAASKVRTLTLRQTKRFAPESAADLPSFAQEQLLAALLRYDGKELSIGARLGPGDYEETGSVRNGLERIELDGDIAIEGFLYMGDSGTFFTKATTDIVAEVVQFAVECNDPALGAALRAALTPPKT
jgi:hypothetical protein